MPEERDRDGSPTGETSPLGPGESPTPLGPAAGSHGGAPCLAHGRVLADRYWPVRLLGRGGMGEVWQAFDLKLLVDVALKGLLSQEGEEARERLRAEVRAAREVVSPHVCRVFDLVEVDGQELLSMEYIDGQTLHSLLANRGPLPLPEARALASQFLSGLEAVHAAGFVHRDFKPENVMITPAGRVVVMDFGIARKSLTADDGAAGTAPYMAPEQAHGGALDPRTDVYAAGVALAEMVTRPRPGERTSRPRIWEGIRREPPRVPDGPWAPVIRRAVSRDPADRPGSALALNRELEEITLRVEGAEDKSPYPGLAPFTEAEAEHFFGREAEVESILRRLRRGRLLALVGPSGAGKSSFLRAGLIPVLPEGWAHVYCQPGAAPFAALGRAMNAEGVTEGPEQASAVALLAAARRWRAVHDEALVVLDQFEELFTLSPPSVQAGFAELVGRLATEADVRVLVSMRDDFFFQCQSFPSLGPLFRDLTPLGPPTGVALHRALVQPALGLGYRFEDESLVTRMLDDVARERGALPLLAFAAAGLWERRDREKGLLTTRAYEDIGGVGGALAQHAERTLRRIGAEHEGKVREIFRNLATAEGTRVAREREELLSVFDDPAAAEAVLRQLVEGRLLTAFEAAESGRTVHRVEVIHESLLEAWPRLLRWRMQDAEGAQLREQLREAARLWEEKGRSPDLLWTGTAYREFALWRERYPGGLTSRETEFAEAMVARARRRRRRWQMASAGVAAAALAVAALVGVSRQQEREARARAEAETLRAEASRLVALGRLELGIDPTVALAFARKSLAMHDTPEARRLAVEALWRGPMPRLLPVPPGISCASLVQGDHGRRLACVGDGGSESQAWSIDGRRLEGGTVSPPGPGGEALDPPRVRWRGRSLLLLRPGGEEEIGIHPLPIRRAAWREDAGSVVSVGEDREIRIWGGPELGLQHVRRGLDARIFSLPLLDRTGTRLAWHSLRERALVLWDLAGPPDAEPLLMRRRNIAGDVGPAVFLGDGRWLASVADGTVALWALELPWPRVLDGHSAALLEVAFTPDSRHLISCGADGARIWPLVPGAGSGRPIRHVGAYTCNGVAVSPDAVLVAAPAKAGFLAPLAGGPAATLAPLPPDESVRAAALDPAGRWAAVAGPRIHLVDRGTGRRRLLPGEGGTGTGAGGIYALRFTSGGSLLSAGEEGVRRWDPESGAVESLLRQGCGTLDASADGGRAVVGCLDRGASDVFVLNLENGERRTVAGHGGAVQAVAIDPWGEVIATGDTTGVVRVGRLDGGEPHLLLGPSGVVSSVDFSPDGRWVAAAAGTAVWLWPRPDLSRAPLHVRPLPEVMATLDAVTNVELVGDEAAPSGYRTGLRPFPGWETPPSW